MFVHSQAVEFAALVSGGVCCWIFEDKGPDRLDPRAACR